MNKLIKRIKPYKEDKPINTINKIRSILSSLGLLISEQTNNNNGFYTSRVVIVNEGLEQYNIGANGKGISMELSLASAYGEFMERLQNKSLFRCTYFFSKYYERDCSFNQWISKNGEKIGFIYDPNEQFCAIGDLLSDPSLVNTLSKFFPNNGAPDLHDILHKINGCEQLLCVPFYSVNEQKISSLPIEVILNCVSSTGMCAGNTPEEALVQGISEILERYAIHEIYDRQLTPPTIQKEIFNSFDIYDEIIQIEKSGLKLEIKDFSLGIGLPVIGVAIYDNANCRYNIKAGADPWPVTALQRCLTELHQSFTGVRLVDKWDYSVFNEMDDTERYLNLANIYNTGMGQWPDSLFQEKPSYKESAINFSTGISNASDLKYLSELIKKLGYDIYVKDMSFLGFPAYYIVIPGMSQDILSQNDSYIHEQWYSNMWCKLNNLCILSEDALQATAHTLDVFYKMIKVGYLNLQSLFDFNTETDTDSLDVDFLLSMIHYRLSNYEKAYSYMDSFLCGKDKQAYKYYYVCKDYMSIKRKKGEVSLEDVNYLTCFYGTVVKDVVDDLNDDTAIFKNYNLQSFFFSKDADIESFHYAKISEILARINKKQECYNVDLMSLKRYFQE